MGASLVLEDEISMEWGKTVAEQAEMTMSICTKAAILAKLGPLDDKPYGTHYTIYHFINELDPEARPQKEGRFVKSDEGLYTSAGISAGMDLSFHIVEKLCGKEVANNTAAYMEYSRN
jgi:transcriptional regulator GlxA family with amidase domain